MVYPILPGNSTMHIRYGDRRDIRRKGQVAGLAFPVASILIILVSASLAFIGLVASREADREAFTSQQRLLDIALKNRFELMARDQLSLARWDDSVLMISRDFDRDFISDEFMESLWFDFGLDRNMLIGPDNKVAAEAAGEIFHFNSRLLEKTDPLYQFVENARSTYFEYRITIPGGYGQELISSVSAGNDASHGFQNLGKEVFLVSAMAIVPDDGDYALPDGNPVILVSAIHLGEKLIADLNDQLSFTDLKFIQPAISSANLPLHHIVSPEGKVLGSLSWQGTMPGQKIWRTVIPVIIILAMLLAFVAYGIAWKIGKLTISLEASEQHNFFLAMHDTLSGLANRLHFNRALEDTLESLSSSSFTLIQGDLDRFKLVNDTLGHAAGDTVIKTVAHRLTAAVGSAGLVGRIGGDEFVILLPDCVDRLRIKKLAEKIIADICIPIETENGESAEIGISLGIAFAPTNGHTSETIMAAADGALYVAKDQGRNQAIFADDVNEPSFDYRAASAEG